LEHDFQMSEIHNQREIEQLQSEIARLEHEKRSAALDWMAAAGQYGDEIARLRFENAKLLEEAQHELMYGYDMASADYKDIMEQQDREIFKLRAALELWHLATKIDVTMEGPQYMGVSFILGRQAWERTRAVIGGENG